MMLLKMLLAGRPSSNSNSNTSPTDNKCHGDEYYAHRDDDDDNDDDDDDDDCDDDGDGDGDEYR